MIQLVHLLSIAAVVITVFFWYRANRAGKNRLSVIAALEENQKKILVDLSSERQLLAQANTRLQQLEQSLASAHEENSQLTARLSDSQRSAENQLAARDRDIERVARDMDTKVNALGSNLEKVKVSVSSLKEALVAFERWNDELSKLLDTSPLRRKARRL